MSCRADGIQVNAPTCVPDKTNVCRFGNWLAMFGDMEETGLFASDRVCNLGKRGRLDIEVMALSERSRLSMESCGGCESTTSDVAFPCVPLSLRGFLSLESCCLGRAL